MDRTKIERINFLARKSKADGLSEAEKAEQQALRDEYREFMRRGYMAQFENTYFIDKDGNYLSDEWFNYSCDFSEGFADVERTNVEWG